jgi:hypothetical protein
MTIKRLKEMIKDLPDDTKVRLHVWTDAGSLFYSVNQAVNFSWQKENGVFLLTNDGLLDRKLSQV